jgi:phosphatidylglycerophosphate synthase
MRSADIATIFRTLLVFPILYLIIIKYNPIVTLSLFIFMFALDGLDGLLARRDIKKGLKPSAYGAKFDIAGDRVTEYSFWILFTVLGVIPLFIIFLIVIRHSFSDAMTAASKKTFSNMSTKFGKIAYSHVSRGLINILKFITFFYLALEYILGYPMIIGYILVGLLVIYIWLRGAAEIYESVV